MMKSRSQGSPAREQLHNATIKSHVLYPILEEREMIAYKLVREDFGSLNDNDRIIYGEEWQEVPGNGAYGSATGEGITAGGVGPVLIRLKVKDRIECNALGGVTRWRTVRRVGVVDLGEAWDKARAEFDKAGAEWDAADAEWENACDEFMRNACARGETWDKACAECDDACPRDELDRTYAEWVSARAECERVVMEVIKRDRVEAD